MNPPQTPYASLVAQVDMPVGRGGALSPDGRWVVFSAGEPGDHTLWIAPAAGGEPRRLLDGDGDSHPAFAPSGDRLYFFSKRVARGDTDDGAYLVAAPFDTRTGALAGDVRQIGMQHTGVPSPLVSPDGQWVAYVSSSTERLVVVPATGGRERTLKPVIPSVIGFELAWHPDSRGLTASRPVPGSSARVRQLMALDASEPQELERGTAAAGRLLPDGEHRLATTTMFGPYGSTRRLLILDARGDTVASAPYPGMDPGNLSPDGRRLFARQLDQEAALHIVSTAGGRTRAIVPANGVYHLPIAFDRSGNIVTARTDTLVIYDARGRHVATHAAPANGRWRYVVDEHATLFLPHTGEGVVTGDLVLVHLPSGRRTTVSTSATLRNIIGGGGAYGLDRDRFLFFERHGDDVELRSVGTAGDVRLIRRMPAGWVPRMAVHGQQLAWADASGDSTVLMVSAGPDAPPRRVATLPASSRTAMLTWSSDGRRMLVTDGASMLAIVTLPAGEGDASVRRIAVPWEYWYETYWTADDEAITMIAQPRDSRASEIVRLDVATGTATILTGDDPNSKWGHALSPDGRLVAYASDVQLGSRLWIYDLEAMIRGR